LIFKDDQAAQAGPSTANPGIWPPPEKMVHVE
jgi:hypothetical protein